MITDASGSVERKVTSEPFLTYPSRRVSTRIFWEEDWLIPRIVFRVTMRLEPSPRVTVRDTV
jgi:hypothetical protein